MSNLHDASGRKNISRRTFINRSAATAFVAVIPAVKLFPAGGSGLDEWPVNASKITFQMIGHGHIDPVWLWPWSEGISVVHSTFRSALDRMNETTDFVFTASSAQFYQWVADNDPLMLAEIRQRVAEGRWNIVGGWWVEPDMNIPSGESMVRQGLYGQLTFERLLGRRATVATNPDSFGHPGTLPQIIRQQGMENYVFMRPGLREKDLPSDLFWWESPDGSKVLTYRIPFSYNDNGSVRDRLKNMLTHAAGQPIDTFMVYYGVGDHGGGASKENIRSINEIKTEKGAPVIFYSSIDRYFDDMRKIKGLEIPVVKDDLQHHAVGCYTAESEIKKSNRMAEAALITAEKISAIGALNWGARYPMNELTQAWKRLLFLQFHDSLAGSSLFDHSQTAREGFGYALDIAHQATFMAAQKLEFQIPAEDQDSQYLVAFNPHAWETTAHIEYDLDGMSSIVTDENGNPLLHQWTAGSSETGGRKKIIIRAPLPAMGYRQIRVRPGEPKRPEDGVDANNNSLENSLMKVTIQPDGSLQVIDKATGNEWFTGPKGGGRALVIDDPSDTWSHNVKAYTQVTGTFGNASIKITENGPLRATIRVCSDYHDSHLTIDWSLYAGSRNLEAKVQLDWHEHQKMVKFSFPVNVESPKAMYEIPYGHIERAVNGNEDPGQRWIDLSGISKGQHCGLTVINDAKYGYSIQDNDLRISIVRSPVYAHHQPNVLDTHTEHLWMDQGIQTFRLLLVPHTGNWNEAPIARTAETFISQPVVIYQGIHGGSMPKSASYLSVDTPHVMVTAIKQAEDGKDLIVRCVETDVQATRTTIRLPFIGQQWSGNFKPCEIKTLRVSGNNIQEVNLLEEIV